jgi:hypothetical protein
MEDEMRAIKIPKGFYRDHVERDLPAPPVIAMAPRHYVIDGDSEHLAELINDAEFYADKDGPDGCPEIKAAAKYLLKRLAGAM